ncbi:MAG TPA: hypothetical protein VN231_01535, partial [Allosphingosinicella sp.]|nr:hypothetical protein [Allosphingosinicella sp.]
MTVSKIAAAAIAVCGACLFGAAVEAQLPPVQPAPPLLSLSPAERSALQALQSAASGFDRAAQDAALAAARSVVRSGDGRYALAHFQLQIGQARQDPQLTAQAVDALVDSGQARPEELASLLTHQASRAYYASEFERADRLLARVAELQPSNAAVIADHAQVKARRGDRPQAVALLQRAIAVQRTSGQPVPESWLQRAVALAVEGRLGPQSIALARELVGAYPTPLNWRDALLVYRQSTTADPALDLDVRRLMRASQALSGERDYLEFADALGRASLPGEVKAVVDEGVSRGMLDANEPIVRQLVTANNRRLTADRAGLGRLRTQALAAATGAPARAAGDSHFGYGQYAEAAELYRVALQKGGEDPNLVNSRLGAALALAGRRAEAEAALRAVTGARADLA